jgi:hypothetical protein
LISGDGHLRVDPRAMILVCYVALPRRIVKDVIFVLHLFELCALKNVKKKTKTNTTIQITLFCV